MLTLWDLLPGAKSRRKEKARARKQPVRERAAPPAPLPLPLPALVRTPAADRGAETMRDRYERITREMLLRHGVKVRKWRTSMSGIAWEVYYEDGRTVRLIEAPRPRGPMSAAVFLHEIGHHAIGFNVYRPRCLEEHHAWSWALSAMEAHGLNVTPAVRKRVRDSMRYAIRKARRRGIRELPAEIAGYLTDAERAAIAATPVPPRRPRRRPPASRK